MKIKDNRFDKGKVITETLKCPLCKKDDHDVIEGNFSIDASDGWHGKQVRDITLYRCKGCGNVFSDKW
jgi:transposase-like protein